MAAAEVSDGCTGVPFFHDLWEGSYQCCLIHDQGGSDWELYNCWLSAGVPLLISVVAIVVMIAARPLYHMWLKIKRRMQ